MNSAADIWERVLSLMQQTMTETTITTWFSDAEPIALDENRFILYVPTDFKREIVASRYIGDIKKALYDLFSAELEVVVLSEECTSIGMPWQSQPGTYGAWKPSRVFSLRIMSLRILLTA